MDELFPFRYVGGGWFRDARIPKGETAEMLHGDHAIAEAMEAAVWRFVLTEGAELATPGEERET